MNLGYVRGNLLTLLFACIAVMLAVIMHVSIEVAYLIWLSAFMLDASYTFHKRRYLQYEMNVIVRRSRNIVLALVKVVMVEFAVIALLSAVLVLLTAEVKADTVYTVSVSVPSAFFILFAVIHILAFIRSYMFMKGKINNQTK